MEGLGERCSGVDGKSPKREIKEIGQLNISSPSFSTSYPCSLLPRISDQHAKVAFFNRTACQHPKRKQTISAHCCYILLPLRLHALIPLPAATASQVVKQSTDRKDGPYRSYHRCGGSASGGPACQCWPLFEELPSHSG
jgi:hypothetical protein